MILILRFYRRTFQTNRKERKQICRDPEEEQAAEDFTEGVASAAVAAAFTAADPEAREARAWAVFGFSARASITAAGV